MPGRKPDDVLTLYVREIIRLWEAPPPEGQGRWQKELAERAGLARSQISMINTGRLGVGFRTARGIAKALGISLDDLERRAAAFAKRGSAALPPEMDRYPNRQAAIDFARPEISKEAIDYVRAFELEHDGDLPRLFWLDRLREADAMLKSPLRQTTTPTAEPKRQKK